MAPRFNPYEETLADVNRFLENIQKDVKLAKSYRNAILNAERLLAAWADRKAGMEFCNQPGCLNVKSNYDNYCIPCERKLEKQGLGEQY